jgi:hypothetical protein
MPDHPAFRRLLAMALLLVSAASTACGLDAWLSAEARDTWKRTYTLAERGAVSLRNSNGRIVVTAGDGNVLEVMAEKIVRAHTEENARLVLGRVTIEETIAPDRIALATARTGVGMHFNSATRVDYTLRVPRGAAVTVRSTNGDIEITGVGGPLEVRTTNGRISGSALRSSATVETTNGLVSLDFETFGESGVTCETTNGAVDVTIPRTANASVSVKVTNGGIEVDDFEMKVVEKSRRRFEGTIGSGGPLIRLETTNGRVRLRGR